MLFWLLAAVLTAVAVSAVLYPLSRSAAQRSRADRRLFVIAAFAIPAVATAAYFLSGATALEDRPYAARETERVAAGLPSDAEAMLIEQLAASVNKRPSDPRGWSLLGNGYFREARYGQAAAAYRNALSHGATDASVASALGESLVLGSDGQVTSDAHDAFRQALALDASDPKARYFLALEQLQGGHAEDAIKSWQEMLRTAPADAPWKELVRGAIEAAKSRPSQRLTDGNAVSGTRSK